MHSLRAAIEKDSEAKFKFFVDVVQPTCEPPFLFFACLYNMTKIKRLGYDNRARADAGVAKMRGGRRRAGANTLTPLTDGLKETTT